ncbi:hypothetical protein A3765_05575 [Oleiphilus sp. HI0130]|nr:hypothetical protein A3758_09170 [Oleiphilus sp. HI0118]KZZ65812.1 hypothetical protein A3765_05575 [Oleiphilus sp. HI0130]
MKRTYRLLKFKAKLVAYVLLIAVLIYVVAGRAILSMTPEYRVTLQDYLSEELQISVEIQQIEVKWSGFDPILEARGISINGASNAHIKVAQIKFAFLNSILARAPRIYSIRLDTANLNLEQDTQGVWFLAGKDLSQLKLPASSESSADAYDFGVEQILDGANLKLVDAFVRISSPDRSDRVWRLPSASLSYVSGRIFAQGNVIRPGGLQPLARFIYNSSELGRSDKLSGELFLEARSSGFLDEHIKAYQWHGISIQAIDASGRAWVSLSGLTVESVFADIQVAQLNWNIEEKSLAPIVNSSVSLGWHGNEHGQRIDLYNLEYLWKGDECSVPGASYEAVSGREEIAVESLNLSCAADIMTSLGIVDGDLAQRIDVGEPNGRLNKLWISTHPSDSRVFSVEAELQDVAIKGYEGAPSVGGVNGYLYTDAESGFVDFQSNDFLLFFPELYLKSWRSTDAQGRVAWWQDGEDFMIESDGIYLQLYEASEVFGDFTLRLNNDEREDYLGLMLGMRNIMLPDVAEFVPFYVVDQDLYRWLSDSLVGGYVDEGKYFAYGSIEKESPDNSFSSSLSLKTKDAVLKYERSWPELEKLSIDLALHEDRLEISADDAEINGTKVKRLDVFMPGVSAAQKTPQLNVKAKLQFEGEEYAYWLKDSPVAESTEEVAKLLSFSGPAMGDLDLDLSLGDEIKEEFSLSLMLDGVRAAHQESPLVAEDLRGRLDISSESGVSAEKIDLIFSGEPGVLSITPNALSDSTSISLQSGLAVHQLLPEDQDWFFGLDGQTRFDALLEIPNDPELATHLRVNSNLEGISSNWPAPLTKLSRSRNNAEVLATIKPNQVDVLLKLNGSALPKTTAELLFIDEEFEFGKVVMSAGDARLNASDYNFSEDGLGILLSTNAANLDSWVSYLTNEIPGGGDGQGASLEWLREVNIRADELDVYDNIIKSVSAVISPKDAGFFVELSGPNSVGSVTINNDTSPILIDLARLKLEESAPEDITYSAGNEPITNPLTIADMKFSVDELYLGEAFWGQWSFWTEKDEKSLIFRDLKGVVAGSVLQGQLSWRYDNQQHYTILTVDGEGENLAPVLSLFGQESPLTSDSYETELALVWPDAPENFSLSFLSGSANMTFRNGQIRTDAQGAGILRLFGIFSLDAIGRRLRLDFSDIYEAGISYDEIDMNAVISQGIVSLVDPLVISGPSSNYEVNGDINLAAQTLDLIMSVELPISSNVPLAALMLGSPTIGGAVWLVDKVLGEPLSSLSTLNYALTGSWDDPIVKLD